MSVFQALPYGIVLGDVLVQRFGAEWHYSEFTPGEMTGEQVLNHAVILTDRWGAAWTHYPMIRVGKFVRDPRKSLTSVYDWCDAMRPGTWTLRIEEGRRHPHQSGEHSAVHQEGVSESTGARSHRHRTPGARVGGHILCGRGPCPGVFPHGRWLNRRHVDRVLRRVRRPAGGIAAARPAARPRVEPDQPLPGNASAAETPVGPAGLTPSSCTAQAPVPAGVDGGLTRAPGPKPRRRALPDATAASHGAHRSASDGVPCTALAWWRPGDRRRPPRPPARGSPDHDFASCGWWVRMQPVHGTTRVAKRFAGWTSRRAAARGSLRMPVR
jgi:hypothetical protein